jgi:hypothetical protein
VSTSFFSKITWSLNVSKAMPCLFKGGCNRSVALNRAGLVVMVDHHARNPQFSRDLGDAFHRFAIADDEATALLAKGCIDLANPLPNKVHSAICREGSHSYCLLRVPRWWYQTQTRPKPICWMQAHGSVQHGHRAVDHGAAKPGLRNGNG